MVKIFEKNSIFVKKNFDFGQIIEKNFDFGQNFRKFRKIDFSQNFEKFRFWVKIFEKFFRKFRFFDLGQSKNFHFGQIFENFRFWLKFSKIFDLFGKFRKISISVKFSKKFFGHIFENFEKFRLRWNFRKILVKFS